MINSMTKEEAIKEMKLGHKVTHRYFGDKEWVTMDGEYIVTEEGYKSYADVFWSYRSMPSFDTGWELFKNQ